MAPLLGGGSPLSRFIGPREIRSEILYSLPAKTEPPFFLLSLFRPAPSRDLTGERERAKFERGRRSPKAEEDVGEGLRAREQREHDPVHHPFHLRIERRRDNIGLFEDGDDDLRRLRKRYSRILSRSSSSPPCKKRRPGTNCRTLIWKSDTGERKWAIGASLLPGGRQAFEGSPGSFSLASDRRSNVRQRESSLLLNGGPPFCTRSRETDSPRFHPVEAPPFSFPFHARAEFLPHLPLRPAWILLAIPATVPSPNSFRSPSPRSDASNWKTSNQKTSNIEPFVLPRL